MNPPIELSVRDLTRCYASGAATLRVLDGVSFDLERGSSAAIVGPSGSGKTTLLGLCAGLDRPTRGCVELAGQRLEDLDEDARARLRNEKVGFVFQSFHLLPTLTALENVMVPLELQGASDAARRAQDLLEQLGLEGRLGHYPMQLSGGEQQRVALARAFVHHPRILFADEPTGNLDADNKALILEHLFALNEKYSTTLVVVTHDLDLARRTRRILHLSGGRLVQGERTEPGSENRSPAQAGSTTLREEHGRSTGSSVASPSQLESDRWHQPPDRSSSG